MKIQNRLILTLASLFLLSGVGHAADIFHVSLRGRCKSTNDAGKIVMTSFNNKTIIRDCAQAEDPVADPKKLALVYDLAKDAFMVVTHEGLPLCDVFGLDDGVSISNTNGTVRERQAFLFLGNDNKTKGSVLGTERITRNADGVLTRFTFPGTFEYATPGREAHPPAICSGSFTIGRRFVPENGSEPQPKKSKKS